MIVREWLTDCYRCEGELDDPEGIEAVLRLGSERVGATIMGRSSTRYEPIGVTVFLPLAESHLMVSTWPEHRFAIVSILLCNEEMDPDVVLREILAYLRPARVRLHRVSHDVEEDSPDAIALERGG